MRRTMHVVFSFSLGIAASSAAWAQPEPLTVSADTTLSHYAADRNFGTRSPLTMAGAGKLAALLRTAAERHTRRPLPTNTRRPTITRPVGHSTPTPSATAVASPTSTATGAPSATAPAPVTNTPAPSSTATDAPAPSATPTITASSTLTATPTDTATPLPTETATPLATDTAPPPDTATPTSTSTPTPRPTPANVTKVWTGSDAAAPTSWSQPSNWSPPGVPTTADVVLVPALAPAQPQLDASVSVGSIFVEDGASVDTGFRILTVTNDVDAGTITGGGRVVMNGTGVSVRGALPNLTLNGVASANGDVAVAGRAIVNGALMVNGHAVETGMLLVENDGVVTMEDPQDVVRVQSYAEFNGGSTDGLLTAGVLIIEGGFLQSNNDGSGSSASFAASGVHRVVFAGSTQSVFFYTPGSGASTSHFQDVELAGIAGNLSLSNTVVNGQLRSPAGVAPTLFGNNAVLSVGGLDVDGLVLDNLTLTVDGGPISAFDNVTFQNQSPDATQLTIAHPGAPVPFTFNDIAFQVTPTTGLYISATDTSSDANVLTINLQCTQPLDGTASTATSGGAVVNWLGCGP